MRGTAANQMPERPGEGATPAAGAAGRLTPTERQIIAYLRDNSGSLNRSKAVIAEELGRSVKTVDRNISDLCRKGVVTVEPSWDEHGAQLPNTYRLA